MKTTIHYTMCCDHPSCDYGSFDYKCPKCGENHEDNDSWHLYDEISKGLIHPLKCKECNEKFTLSYDKEEGVFEIEHQ